MAAGMNSIDPMILAEALQQSPDGVAIAEYRDGHAVVTFANTTLAALLKQPAEWFAGRPLEEIESESPTDPTATGGTVGLRVQLRTEDAALVECERWALLLPEGRMALYYRPSSRRAPGALAAALERGSGLATPEHLREVLRRDWSIAQRDGRTVTVMRFDVDACATYREVFGRGATENALRQVARTISSAMRRTSDVVARFSEDHFVVLGAAMDEANAVAYAETILARIRSLAIHHPRSPTGRYLSASAGVVTAAPPRGQASETILEAASQALERAKREGGNRAAAGSLG